MKTFKEIRGTDTEDLTESRLLRRGIATGYGLRARNEGKKVEMELNSAKNALRPRPNDTTEEQLKRLQEGLIQMCDANIALRHQLGAITAIVVSGQLLNERTNAQLEKVLKKLQIKTLRGWAVFRTALVQFYDFVNCAFTHTKAIFMDFFLMKGYDLK